MTDSVGIRVQNVWKRYGLPILPTLQRVGRRLRGLPDEPRYLSGPWSLRGIDLEVRRGETIGLIGHNGAGKSTLLKILAGVTPPTYGRVEVRGRVFPMIELNAGLHPELSGRENVYLLGAVMGLRRSEVSALLPRIEDFSELGEWFERPVRKYSSGMLSRLGFSVAMHVDADILLIDEVLAVGDLAFQQKCYSQIARFRASQDKITLLVSHNLRQVARLCDKTYLMDAGRFVDMGDSERIVNQYMHGAEDDTHQEAANIQPSIESSGLVELLDVTLLDADGRPTQAIRTGAAASLRARFRVSEPLNKPVVGVGITSADLLVVAGVDSWNVAPYDLYASPVVECRFERLPILPGLYFFNLGVTDGDNGARLFAGRNLLRFRVLPDEDRYPSLRHTGLLALDAGWSFAEG